MVDVVAIITLIIVIVILIFMSVIAYFLNKERGKISGIIKKFDIKQYLQGHPDTGNVAIKYGGTDPGNSAVWMI